MHPSRIFATCDVPLRGLSLHHFATGFKAAGIDGNLQQVDFERWQCKLCTYIRLQQTARVPRLSGVNSFGLFMRLRCAMGASQV